VSTLPESHARILRALLAVWDRERFIVIGAAAIEARLGLRWRGTLDLDLSAAAGLDAYPRDLESLGWRRERTALQRWVAPDGALVDVLPGAPALVRQGGFTWPDGSAHVNLAGFRLPFADAALAAVAPDLSVRVASLRSLVLLKMAAYLDRPGNATATWATSLTSWRGTSHPTPTSVGATTPWTGAWTPDRARSPESEGYEISARAAGGRAGRRGPSGGLRAGSARDRSRRTEPESASRRAISRPQHGGRRPGIKLRIVTL
jgi:hypothetical protein